MSPVNLSQILSIVGICGLAVADLALIAILIIERKKLKRGLRNVLVVLVVLLTLALAGLIALSYAAGSNRPESPPQPYPIAGNDTSRSFFLANATQKERLERLLSVTLYDDGAALLPAAMFSSFALHAPVYYTFSDDELLIHYESGEVIARFGVIDNNTLVFNDATVPLYAEPGARYVYMPQWMSFDGQKISIYAGNIPGLEVVEVIDGNVNRWSIKDEDEIVRFAEWAGNLVLEGATFAAGESPGDSAGEWGYLLGTSFGASMFEYGKYSDGEHYIRIDNDWYHVGNPSGLPLNLPR